MDTILKDLNVVHYAGV